MTELHATNTPKNFIPLTHVEPIPNQPRMLLKFCKKTLENVETILNQPRKFLKFCKKTLIWKEEMFSLLITELHAKSIPKKVSFLYLAHVELILNQPQKFLKSCKKSLIWEDEIFSLLMTELHATRILNEFHPSSKCWTNPKSTPKVFTIFWKDTNLKRKVFTYNDKITCHKNPKYVWSL